MLRELYCYRIYWSDTLLTKLMEMLRNIGVNWRERRLIRNLYMGQRENCASIKGKLTVLRMEEESDRDVACHSYYLTYMENI